MDYISGGEGLSQMIHVGYAHDDTESNRNYVSLTYIESNPKGFPLRPCIYKRERER